jgi:hypothetical protein
MTTLLILVIACACFGFWTGKVSNTMTSPRQAFNIWVPLFGAICGAVVGLIYGFVLVGMAAAIIPLVGSFAGCGFTCTGAGLGVARLLRR